jgi:hypothetical protein
MCKILKNLAGKSQSSKLKAKFKQAKNHFFSESFSEAFFSAFFSFLLVLGCFLLDFSAAIFLASSSPKKKKKKKIELKTTKNFLDIKNSPLLKNILWLIIAEFVKKSIFTKKFFVKT